MQSKDILGRLAGACDVRVFNTPKSRNIILVIALACFIGGLAIAFQHQPQALERLNWGLIAIVVVIGVPITLVFNTFEFVLSARLIGQRIAFLQALEITTVGSAANLLPLPGGMGVRILGLKAAGATYKDSITTTLFVAFMWLGVSFTYAGAWIYLVAPGLTARLFLFTGLVILAPSLIIAIRMTREWRTPGLLLGVKVALVVADVFTVYLCLLAIGTGASFAQASAFAISGPLGSAVSIVPAGLGIREAVSAAVAPVVGLGAASGFLATALNRMLGYSVVIPVVASLLLRNTFRKDQLR